MVNLCLYIAQQLTEAMNTTKKKNTQKNCITCPIASHTIRNTHLAVWASKKQFKFTNRNSWHLREHVHLHGKGGILFWHKTDGNNNNLTETTLKFGHFCPCEYIYIRMCTKIEWKNIFLYIKWQRINILKALNWSDRNVCCTIIANQFNLRLQANWLRYNSFSLKVFSAQLLFFWPNFCCCCLFAFNAHLSDVITVLFSELHVDYCNIVHSNATHAKHVQYKHF